MKMTFDLPSSLLDEAVQISGANSKRDAVIAALESLVRKHRILGIKKYKGKVDLTLNLGELRARR